MGYILVSAFSFPPRLRNSVRVLRTVAHDAGTPLAELCQMIVEAGGNRGKDPEGAAGRALKLPPGRARMEALNAAVKAWARKDPRAALAWVDQLPSGHNPDELVRTVFEKWVPHEPAAAFAYAIALPPGRTRSPLGRCISSIPSILSMI